MAKRFYKDVAIAAQDNGFVVTLDGRTLKTPGKQDLVFKGAKNARLVADEWQAQTDGILPETMPCTRLMNVACELTPSKRPELIKEFTAYMSTDLLCYRADTPQDLVDMQESIWQSTLDWAGEKFAINLRTTTSLKAAAQPKASLARAADYAAGCDDAALTLLLHFTACFGSSVLALSVIEGHKTALEAYENSRLDELFQIGRWGEDPLTVERVDNMKTELSALAKLIS